MYAYSKWKSAAYELITVGYMGSLMLVPTLKSKLQPNQFCSENTA